MHKTLGYDGSAAKNIAKWAKRLKTQVQYRMSDAFDPVPVIIFPFAFKLACDTHGSLEGAAQWLFYYFIKSSSAAALNTRLCLKQTSLSNTHKAIEVILTTYPEMVSYLLQSYVTDDVISESDAAITR